MPYLIENLEQYDITDNEVATLERFGFIYANTEENPNPELCETTALVWEELGLEGERAYVLFDAVLGRKTKKEG